MTLDVKTNLNVLMETLEYCKSKDIVFNYVSTGFVYGPDILYASEEDSYDPEVSIQSLKVHRTVDYLFLSSL